MDLKIGIATHKSYRMPEESIYIPIQVGAEGKNKLGYTTDNTGDNISAKNKNFCELTGLYWMWKNMSAEYLGLVHYRRYFVCRHGRDKWNCIATKTEVERKLQNYDVILPNKRNYYIETTYNQYAHAHNAIDLDITRDIIEEKYPDYINSFDSCMNRTSGHKFNMFIMKRDLMDEYCVWLFDILFELEKRLDISHYTENDSRVFGFVAERLLDVWIEKNCIVYTEMKVAFMEKQNWVKKGGDFLLRKFGVKQK